MFSPRLRLVFAVVGLAAGLFEISRGHAIGWLYLPAALLLAYGYFRYGTIWLAFQAFRRGELEKVELRLAQVRDPAHLRPQERAYYEFLKGAMALRRGDSDIARAHLERAVEGPFRTDNMRSVALGHLSEAAFEAGDREAARGHLAAARAIPHSSELDQVLVTLDEKIGQDVPPTAHEAEADEAATADAAGVDLGVGSDPLTEVTQPPLPSSK